MTTLMVIAVILGVLGVVGGARFLLRGKEDRLARRELRRLRWRERAPDLRGAAEHRRNMTMDPMPGKDGFPLGP